MSISSLLESVLKVLKTDPRLVSQDGDLLKNKAQELAYQLDPTIIGLLLKNDLTKSRFFKEIDGCLIFDQNAFVSFVMNKEFLPDSYTSYKNKIGLNIDGKTLDERKEVSLVWAYKDCVLAGGQDKEDSKRDEIFYNETLGSDQIDRLLDPKVFTGFKRIDIDGKHDLKEFRKDENGNITDNLIIKGNNLLALHSLKKVFKEQVKLIYIDPPYNRDNEGNDFLYNDKFNHSTWLTFMKNRINVASELLKQEGGIIWVSISDDEAHYLKIIMDEIFGRENFIADVIWNSTKSVTNTALISDAHTHNLVYTKNKSWLKQNRTTFRMPADESKFSNPDNDPKGKWVADPFQVGGVRKNQLFEITNPNTGQIYRPLEGNSWKNEKKVFDELMLEGRIIFGVTGDAGPQRKRYWNDAEDRGEVTTTLWSDLPTTTNATSHLKKLFGGKVFDGPKPEGLIERIINLSTKPGDIVLDYHLGSGTTCTVAHKMGRQYIGIEQMDYIETISCERLKKVIDGEQGGISEAIKWKGGGDFVYMKMFENLEQHLQIILKATHTDELLEIWNKLKKSAFINYRIDVFSIDNTLEEYRNLSIEDQKKILIESIDKNALYISLSEIDDISLGISEIDKKLTNNFYTSN